jgi:hypothetical protein
MSPEITALLDQFLRDITAQGCGVFGLVYRMEPEPAMTILRNRSGDPAIQAESVMHIIKEAVHDGRIAEQDVQSVN